MSSAFLSLSVSPEEDEEPELEEDEGVGVLGPLSLSAFTLAEITDFPACGVELLATFLASPGLERAQVSIGFAELAAGFGTAEAAGFTGAVGAAAGLCAGVGAAAGFAAPPELLEPPEPEPEPLPAEYAESPVVECTDEEPEVGLEPGGAGLP